MGQNTAPYASGHRNIAVGTQGNYTLSTGGDNIAMWS